MTAAQECCLRPCVSPAGGALRSRPGAALRRPRLSDRGAAAPGPAGKPRTGGWIARSCRLPAALARLALLVLSMAALSIAAPARAGESGAGQALDGLGGSLLPGMRACEAPLNDGFSAGARCLAGRAVNEVLLDAAAGFATGRGQAVFGEGFRIVNDLEYAPEGNRLGGGIDVVVPLVSFGPSADPGTAAPDTGALFLQQGVTRWVDGRGSARNDVRFGAVRRFALPGGGAGSDFLGVSAFVQQNREYEHARIVMGADYAGRWGRGALNLFMPTTGWRGRGDGYEERALGGGELGLRLDLTTALSMNAAVGHWQDDDGSGGWRTNGRIAAGWRPHPWLDIGVAWNGLGTPDGSQAFRLAFTMPLGGTRGAPRWRGLGLAGGGSRPPAADLWSPVEDIGVIRVTRRESARSLVSQATVRFVQERAASGARIAIEVRLPAATPRALRLVARLGPGTGGDPAVPGVDYVDEPIPVTIAAGGTRAVVPIQLPLNPGLTAPRSLRVAVALAR